MPGNHPAVLAKARSRPLLWSRWCVCVCVCGCHVMFACRHLAMGLIWHGVVTVTFVLWCCLCLACFPKLGGAGVSISPPSLSSVVMIRRTSTYSLASSLTQFWCFAGHLSHPSRTASSPNQTNQTD